MEEQMATRGKDMEELYALLKQREEEIEKANKYSEALLDDK